MDTKKIILVTGATGAQGGSVARALLNRKEYTVRILTRDVSSVNAIKLREAGAGLVEGNMDDTASLLTAMQDCYGVFGVTSFWEHYEKEQQQGKNLVDAVKQSGIRHFVFSTLEAYNKMSGYTLPVPHYDIKAELREYAIAQKVPATFTHLSFYYENFMNLFAPQKTADGKFYFGFPQGNTKMAAVSVEDIGNVVATIFEYPQEYIGRTVSVVGDDMTMDDYAAIMTKVLQLPVHYNYIPRDEYAALGFPAAEEIANMFEVRRLYIPESRVGLIESFALNPAMQNFKSWLTKNKERFAAALGLKEEVA